MSKEETKQHFAEICECIWNKIESQDNLDRKTADSMRKIVANFAMTAWNMSLAHSSIGELKKSLKKFAEANYEGSPCAMIPLMDAAELKWREYRHDTDFIVKADVEISNGKPHAVAYLKGERPDIDNATGQFQSFMNSPAIQERMKHIPPDKLEEEISKIVAEYNASLPKSDEPEDGTEERDFPITRDELDFAYDFTSKQAPQDIKKEILKELLSIQPFLAPLCENAYQNLVIPVAFSENQKIPFTGNTIPDIILTLASVYMPDTNLMKFDKKAQRQLMDIAKDVVSDFIADREKFEETLESFPEPELYAFLAETLDKFNLSPKDFKRNLTVLMMWGFMIEEARKTQHPDKYPEDIEEDDEQEEEHYDFGRQKTLRLFYLHVKLRGCRVSVDLTVPEDTTFDQLHTVLNSIFKRDDNHLYRFECDDGCTAVRDEEELEDGGAVLADKCYLGHHLKHGSKVFYLFDYGDEWEHDITVKRVTTPELKDCHFEILKITGEIPEQYPDYEEEDE